MLYDKLRKYAACGVYPMHMPGHKRDSALLHTGLPYGIDITEIHGFDDLRYLDGVLGETASLAAELYGSKKAFMLVNGSTVGILAAIGASTTRGDKILFAEGCHRSVFNAVSLFGLRAVHPVVDLDLASGVEYSVTPAAVEAALNSNPDIRLVVITSPTYEGVVSDLESIAEVVHMRGIPLLVDSAHGAHLGFSEAFPKSAVQSGADIVVMSLHKTLPALTQCSLLHVVSDRVNICEIERLLFTLQTSSPSYVLMASIDHCLRLLKSDNDRLFREYERRLVGFYDKVKQLKRLYILGSNKDGGPTVFPRTQGYDSPLFPCSGFFSFDPGKIVIVTSNTSLTGVALSDILRDEYQIELEAAHPNYTIAMTSICDNDDGFDKLANALLEIGVRVSMSTV